MKHYIKLARPFTLLAPAVGFVCGSVMARGGGDAGLSAAVWVGAAAGALINAFSNALNQIHDLGIDRINRPERPLPSGALTVARARVFCAVTLAASLAMAYAVRPRLVPVFAGAAFLTWLYSAPPARLKRWWAAGNLSIALARGVLVPVAGWAAVAPPDRPDPWAAGAVLGLFLFGAAGTKDFADAPGDRAAGVRSLPVALGPARAARIMAPFLVVPFLLIPLFIQYHLLARAAMPVTALALYGAFVAFIMLKHYRSDDVTSDSRAVWILMYLLLMLAQVAVAVCYAAGG